MERKSPEQIKNAMIGKLDYFRDILLEIGFNADSTEHIDLSKPTTSEPAQSSYSVAASLPEEKHAFVQLAATVDHADNTRIWVKADDYSFKGAVGLSKKDRPWFQEIQTEDDLISYLNRIL